MHIRARFVSVYASCVVAVWVVWCLTQAPQDGAGPQAGMTQPRPLLQVATSHHTATSPSCSYGLVVLRDVVLSVCGCVQWLGLWQWGVWWGAWLPLLHTMALFLGPTLLLIIGMLKISYEERRRTHTDTCGHGLGTGAGTEGSKRQALDGV